MTVSEEERVVFKERGLIGRVKHIGKKISVYLLYSCHSVYRALGDDSHSIEGTGSV
jgi:hypothetical protein